jgi:hypothetical protein
MGQLVTSQHSESTDDIYTEAPHDIIPTKRTSTPVLYAVLPTEYGVEITELDAELNPTRMNAVDLGFSALLAVGKFSTTKVAKMPTIYRISEQRIIVTGFEQQAVVNLHTLQHYTINNVSYVREMGNYFVHVSEELIFLTNHQFEQKKILLVQSDPDILYDPNLHKTDHVYRTPGDIKILNDHTFVFNCQSTEPFTECDQLRIFSLEKGIIFYCDASQIDVRQIFGYTPLDDGVIIHVTGGDIKLIQHAYLDQFDVSITHKNLQHISSHRDIESCIKIRDHHLTLDTFGKENPLSCYVTNTKTGERNIIELAPIFGYSTIGYLAGSHDSVCEMFRVGKEKILFKMNKFKLLLGTLDGMEMIMEAIPNALDKESLLDGLYYEKATLWKDECTIRIGADFYDLSISFKEQ